jgi:4-amino-4-deoxychorismate lyase
MKTDSLGMNYGIGLFETLRIRAGRPEYLEAHLKRFMDSAEILEFKDIGRDSLVKALEDHLQASGLREGRLKILYNDLGLFVTSGDNPYGDADYERGMALRLSKVRVPTRSLYTLKTTNYLIPYYEHQKAKAAGFDEVIFTNDLGNLVEGSKSNLFLIKNDKVVTPDLQSGCLEGILRQVILADLGEICTETEIKSETLPEFEAGFITNSLMGVMPIAEIEGQVYNRHHPLVQELIKIYSKEG